LHITSEELISSWKWQQSTAAAAAALYFIFILVYIFSSGLSNLFCFADQPLFGISSLSVLFFSSTTFRMSALRRTLLPCFCKKVNIKCCFQATHHYTTPLLFSYYALTRCSSRGSTSPSHSFFVTLLQIFETSASFSSLFDYVMASKLSLSSWAPRKPGQSLIAVALCTLACSGAES